MAVLTRNKSTIFGLNADLATLVAADLTEKTRAEAAEAALQASIVSTTSANSTASTSNATAIAAENTRALAAEATITSAVAAETTARGTAIGVELARALAAEALVEGRLDAVEGSGAGSIAKAQADAQLHADTSIAALVDGSPELLNTLNELAAAINDDASFSATIAADIAAAKAELIGAASTATDTMGEIEIALAAELARASAAEAVNANAIANLSTGNTSALGAETAARIAADLLKLNIAANLSDVADVAVSRTNLSVDSSAEVSDKVRLGGAISKVEMLTVSGNDIVLSFEPKDGMIFNFSTVRHVDSNNVAWDIPVIAGGTTKTYVLSGDTSGQFNTKSVMVQYQYIAL